jgi:hypothetical protein
VNPRDRLSRPVLAGLLFAGWLASRGPAEVQTAEARPPSSPSSGSALLTTLEILHLRAHAAAERLEWMDVGVHPVPRRAKR